MPAEEKKEKKARIGVLGASGYTGAELVRLLMRHPRVEIVLLTADRRAGKAMADVFPQFLPYALPTLSALDAAHWQALGLDLAFCALPHGTTQTVIKDLLARRAAHQGRRPFGRLPSRRSGGLCALVRPRPRRAGVAERRGLRPHRNLSARDQGGAARRQSRLLHELRRAGADPAVEGERDRCRRDRHRRQIGRHRSGQGGARGYAVLGSIRRHFTPTASATTATWPSSTRNFPGPPAAR